MLSQLADDMHAFVAEAPLRNSCAWCSFTGTAGKECTLTADTAVQAGQVIQLTVFGVGTCVSAAGETMGGITWSICSERRCRA